MWSVNRLALKAKYRTGPLKGWQAMMSLDLFDYHGCPYSCALEPGAGLSCPNSKHLAFVT